MFTDALEVGLTLTIDGNKLAVPGGNVKSFSVNLHQCGFSGRSSFVVSSEKRTDKVFDSFIKQTLMEVELQVSPHYKPEGKKIDPLKLHGLVTQKAILLERTIEKAEAEGNPVIYRHYEIDFADAAQVLWRRHFPCDLEVGKTMKDVLEAHKGSKVTLTYDWDALTVQHPIIALPLGAEGNEASFYDFVLWYADTRNGVWTYKCKDNSYALTGSKSRDGEATALDRRDIDRCEIQFPETIRYSVNLLNAYSETPKIQAIAQDNAVEGVHRDYIGRFPVAADFQDRRTLETERLKARNHEIRLTFRRYPGMTYTTGIFVKLEGGMWSDTIFPKGKVYRVREIVIEATSAEEELSADHDMPYARFDVEMYSQLETREESVVGLFPYRTPRFPMYVEGKIVSEQGGDDEATYQIYQDSNTSLDQYKIQIPLWENRRVVAEFEPDSFMGRFYFPAYKNARVLVSLDLHSARIERFLDWKPGARLPMDTQGNHLLLGKKATSQTSIKHAYVDNKPELSILRTSDKDTELIKLGEGVLVLQTKEDSGG